MGYVLGEVVCVVFFMELFDLVFFFYVIFLWICVWEFVEFRCESLVFRI